MPKYNVNFSDSAYTTLGELARELDQNMAEVVRDALTTYWWLVEQRKQGNTLLLVYGKGRRSEVVFPALARIGKDNASTFLPADEESGGIREE